MNHERLQSMPIGDLKKFALNLGIELPGQILRDVLIEMIQDNLEETQREKAEQNNLLILGEEKKFEISDDAELEAAATQVYPIPERYQKTEAVLIVRDPNWAFAYWEITEHSQAELKSEPGFEQLVLRVHDVELVAFDGGNSNSYFDIPIQFSDNSWYIYLPHPNCSYLFELGFLCGQEYRILARSNVIRTPRGSRVAPRGRQEPDIFASEPLFNLASSSDVIPQRISARKRD
jgi:hypothetical protein